ncbi:MAG: hypothetical protein HYZ75_00320 [Elusimicrobia bacterium]|nr:hypothetical protein [Elusimicrobiota bacterium]
MPSGAERGGDPLKDYWWLLLVAVVFVGGWLSSSSPTSTGADEIQLAARQENAAEQSLRSLDSSENPAGAPGSAAASGASAGAHGRAAAPGGGADGQPGSLYQAPGAAAGSPIPEGAGAEIAAAAAQGSGGGNSLADALRGVAAAPAKQPDNGWGGAAPRTGLKPKAAFGLVGASRMGGGGSTGAQLVNVEKAFGTGGNPGLNLNPAKAPGAGGRVAAALEGSAGMAGLNASRKAGLNALKSGDELAAGRGRQSFDGSAAARSAMGQLRETGASGVNGGDGVPTNLKANDPSHSTKEFEPPPLAETAEQKDPGNKDYMKQQMMMMMLGIAVTGILGPALGGMSMMMFKGLGGTTPPPGNHDISVGKG